MRFVAIAKDLYNTKDVLAIQNKDRQKKLSLRTIFDLDESKALLESKWDLVDIPLVKIKKGVFSFNPDFEMLRVGSVAYKANKNVYDIILAYKARANVPPLWLDSDLSVLDGNHRMAALEFLGIKKIKAFIPAS
jgi:hypothetical protein